MLLGVLAGVFVGLFFGEDDTWRIYVNRWIDLRQQDGTFERIYNHVVKPWFETEKEKQEEDAETAAN